MYRRARKNNIFARRASEANLFFLGFPRGKKPLHNRSYENSFAKATWWWMLHRTLRKVTCTNMRNNMYVVTPRCAAAAAVVSAVVFRRPTKEYTHPYSMMHRRLPTAGIEVAPHYHQLLVVRSRNRSEATTSPCISWSAVLMCP